MDRLPKLIEISIHLDLLGTAVFFVVLFLAMKYAAVPMKNPPFASTDVYWALVIHEI